MQIGDKVYWTKTTVRGRTIGMQRIDGVLPRWTGMSYLVKSATRPESIVHRVRRLGDVWLCSCEATGYCWHCALVTAVEQAEPAQQDDAIKAMAELF